jgi:predicted O-methyltransferase YrrM
METSMTALVSEMGYPWYVGMLADEGVSTVGDVLQKVGLHRVHSEETVRARLPDVETEVDGAQKALRRSPHSASATSICSTGDEPTTRADLLLFVSAYLISLGFSETHADEISEEVITKHDDAFKKQKRVFSADRLFQFDTLDLDGTEERADADAENITGAAGSYDDDDDDSDEGWYPSGPSEQERQTVRAAIAASKARVAARRSRQSGCSASPPSAPRSEETTERDPSSAQKKNADATRLIPRVPHEALDTEGPRSAPRRDGGDGGGGGGGCGGDGVRDAAQEKIRRSAYPTAGSVRGEPVGVYDADFLELVKPLYDLHMGAENLGPHLYSLVRFTKPARVLEVGAGYTSAFLLRALRDNASECETYRALRSDGLAVCGDAPWSVDAFFEKREETGRYRGEETPRGGGCVGGGGVGGGGGPFRGSPAAACLGGRNPSRPGVSSEGEPLRPRDDARKHFPAPCSEDARVDTGVLHCIDNMAHEHTTARAVMEVARKIHCDDRLRLHVADAFDPDLPSTLEPGTEFDLLWIDLGAAHRIDAFVEAWWPRVRDEGGMVIVHSTLTNALSRGWLEKMRALARQQEPSPSYGRFETLSLLEPHKMFQNSFTVFQKRGGAFGRYDEPVHTKFP